jgi:DNA-binding response OmpR family regulator
MPAPGAIPHVLVVDDDPLMQTLVRAFLEKLRARATVCADAASAHAALRRATEQALPVDLVLVDMQLGSVSGLDLCRQLRAEGVDVSIVCISGDPGARDRRTYEEAGFDEVIGKPFGLRDLEACILRHAWRKHGQQGGSAGAV